jgi:hypothetical protein
MGERRPKGIPMAEVAERRHLKTRISLRLLASLIDVPDDVRVVQMVPTSDPDGLMLVLESGRFDLVPDDAESPFAYGLCQEVATDDESGKRFFRLTLDV